MSLVPTAANITSATQYGDWDAFVRTVPSADLVVTTPETLWHRYLKEKYTTVEALNEKFGTSVASLDDVPWPAAEIDRLDWDQHTWRYTAEVVLKNYRRVLSLCTDASSAIWNTARFAILFTLLAVLVNGCAAYVLSRFSLGPIQMALIFFLALAAFPLEAIAVPNFILLRSLGLLNSVWALVLPTAVNGYYVYLLKSFFDSIPKSFMEEAVIEGAGEWNLFWNVSMPLARPMLSVVALYAFLWSYSNFMWALIVCQSRTQWTLPVLIFNMTTWTSTPMQAAAMVFALVPPMLVFVFAHRTIQRSLSLPRF
jgi:ABC-type glycerol-3-phosphate transport system permease component